MKIRVENVSRTDSVLAIIFRGIILWADIVEIFVQYILNRIHIVLGYALTRVRGNEMVPYSINIIFWFQLYKRSTKQIEGSKSSLLSFECVWSVSLKIKSIFRILPKPFLA